MTLAEVERLMIFAALERFGGNKPEAAKCLGISLKTIYNRLDHYEREKHLCKDQYQSPDESQKISESICSLLAVESLPVPVTTIV